MFTVDSIIPKTWAKAVLNGDKTFEEVPNLSNLREIVDIIIKGGE